MKRSGSDGARSGLGLCLLLSVGVQAGAGIEAPIVFTQLPLGDRERPVPALQLDCDGARIAMLLPDGTTRVLTPGFQGACDADVSFDGIRMLFAGRRQAADPWNIFEMDLESGTARRITHGLGNCRRPTYQGRLFTLDSPEPWFQITFVSDHPGEFDEHGETRSTSLYTIRLDGSGADRLTYNPSSDLDPTPLPDGRLLFASWQRATLAHGRFGRISLFASQIDGLDYALFSGEGRRVQRMPTVTDDRRVVFVENDVLTWDGAGSPASLSLRRNLHSYEPIAVHGGGLFHSPSPLPGGDVLISRRPANGDGNHGVHRLDPDSGEIELIHDDPSFHDVQARLVTPRDRPDGRSTVLSSDVSTGVLYGLNAYDSDLAVEWISPNEPLRLRVLEGLSAPRPDPLREPTLLRKRFLGEIDVERDGSFQVRVPANTPVQLQLVDGDGLALATCGWIWVRNRESRGCIGCHEDGERTPENRFVSALAKPAAALDPPAGERRTVDFRRDVAPILSSGCGVAACHAAADERAYERLLAGFAFDDESADPVGTHVHPGQARTSPLIWHVLGKNTSRPWDEARKPPPGMPMVDAKPLSADDLRTLAEWIDLGAHRGGDE